MPEVPGAVPVYSPGRQTAEVLLEAQVQGCEVHTRPQPAEREEWSQIVCLMLL